MFNLKNTWPLHDLLTVTYILLTRIMKMYRFDSAPQFTYELESGSCGSVPFRFWHYLLHVPFLVTWRRGALVIALLTAIFFTTSPFAHAQSSSTQEPDNRETYADWVVECYEQTASKAKCQVYQRILFKGGKSVALVVTVTPPVEEQVGRVQIALPLGIKLSQGAKFKVDENFNYGMAIDRCTNRGCIIENTMPQPLIESMNIGQQATISVVTENGSPFNIPLSLKGFKEAYTRLVTVHTQ